MIRKKGVLSDLFANIEPLNRVLQLQTSDSYFVNQKDAGLKTLTNDNSYYMTQEVIQSILSTKQYISIILLTATEVCIPLETGITR